MFGRHRPSLDLLSKCGLPLWIVTLDPRSPHSEGLDVFIGETIYDGDRTDHGHRERDYPEDDGLDSAAVHRNADVLLPTSHSCSKLHRKTEGMPTEGPDNLANRRDDKFTDQRGGREGFKGGARKRGTLSTSDCRRKKPRMCRLSHNTDKTHVTRDEREAAAPPVAP